MPTVTACGRRLGPRGDFFTCRHYIMISSLDATATYVDDKREGSTDKTGFGRRGSLDVSCAVCVVGQLARLELQSKVRHTLARTHISLAISLALAPRA